ncbi:hypothetical protein CARUB_v10003013mg [Capsella rubella]|uniref:RRM domain-containing protein n=1 Tax=Capsella rubella TaxID=81985 RepID=R0H7V3_9BRAS|nr:hypothetical protein CARUB_v10003013mg [Capsella rubella]
MFFSLTLASPNVVFLEPAEARAAMKGMAYKCYKGSPLYLEWAPGDILEPEAVDDNIEKKSDVEENDVTRVNSEQHAGINSDIPESNVLHVKNLNFKTSDESLKKHLTELVTQGKILSVKIINNGKNRPTSNYGFVEFDSIETATSVLKGRRSVLDDHELILSYFESKQCETVGEGSDKDKTMKKLCVKNVAFEATIKELRQLFIPFGQVKSVRIPKKNAKNGYYTGSSLKICHAGKHAGYDFIEFGTKEES